MKAALLCITFLLFITQLNAQLIKGTVNDVDNHAFANATVSLLQAKDSSIVKLGITKMDGSYVFQSITSGHYLVSITHVGYAKVYSTAFILANESFELPALVLRSSTGNLKDVTVTSKKQMIEVRADKIIVNVEGSSNAIGNDVLELLRKSPGVAVDKDDNLSVSGKTGVQIYIDGRTTPLGGQDLSNYLKSLHASQVEAIEIITNPSAKYEAAGNAGIINIRLKKDQSLGTNGSFNGGIAIGTYPKYNGGISINHRNKRFNLYAGYNYNSVHAIASSTNYRTILDTLFDQKNKVEVTVHSNNIKTGIDYYIDKKKTIGIMFNGTFANNYIVTEANTPISYIPAHEITRILVAESNNKMGRKIYNGNVNYSFVDGNKRNLSLNADAGFYDLNGDQLQPNIYYNASGLLEMGRFIYDMHSPSHIQLYSLKADWEQDFHKGKLAIGGKTSLAITDNDFQRFDVYGTTGILDRDRSNRFKYRENIDAVYFNYNRSYKGWMVQAGLRSEYTSIEGKSIGSQNQGSYYSAYDSGFKRGYIDFFPSAALTINKDPLRQWTFTYSRRIDRPVYQDLNPFEFKIDEYTFAKGNTRLRPQYSNSFGASFLYKQKLNLNANYTRVTDIFSQLLDTADRSKLFQSKQNLATQDIVSLNITLPYRHRFFSFFINSSSYYAKYQADFGLGRKLNNEVFATRFLMQNSIKFLKVWNAELTANYSSPSIIQGTFKAHAMYSLDLGIQKQLFKGVGSVKVSVSDIFKTMNFVATSSFAGQYVRSGSVGETRLFKLNVSYRFGNSQVKAARQRKTGLEEEAARVQ